MFTCVFCAFLPLIAHTAEETAIDFSRDILPLLSDNCFACHGRDASHRKAKLRLDTREGALAGTKGRPAIVPGNINKGTLLERIRTSDPDEVMPPSDSHRKPLTPKQITLIERWIKDGAPWTGHWAFTPPIAPPLADTATHPIDALITKRLQQEGLTLAPVAEAHQLARRLSFSLTGLPPTAEQVARVSSGSDGYRAVVDELLASPHYGERMAMWWLDVARYADTDGFQADDTRTNWPWRDWVIEAFNNGMPFDRFTTLQLAGDLVPKATDKDRLATCFNRNHMCNGEGGRDPEESRIDYVIDRVNTTGTAWLGLTVGCAQCHDHKFDPISQHEYYALNAFFDSIDEDGKAGNNAKPFLKVSSPYVSRALKEAEQLVSERQAAEQTANRAAEAPFRKWLSDQQQSLSPDFQAWVPLRAQSLTSDEGTTLTQAKDASIRASGPHPNQDVYRITGRSDERITGLLLEVIPDKAFTNGSYTRGKDGFFVLTDIKVRVGSKESSQVRDVNMRRAIADVEDNTKGKRNYGAVKGILDDDPRNGWTTTKHDPHQVRTAQISFEEPIQLAKEEHLIVELHQRSTLGDANIGLFRISLTAEAGPAVDELSPAPREQLASLLKTKKAIPVALEKKLREQFLVDYQPYQIAKHAYDRAKRQRDEIAKAKTVSVMVMAERSKPRTTHVLKRGVWDAKGDEVQPSVPSALAPLPIKGRATRLDLARWLTSPSNPLTARVFVNHLWQLCFGQGLVRTADDFGLQGEQPVHQPVLDWLAVECVRSGWDVRHLLRLIVTSHTFQQQSSTSATLRERDPDNRLLARGPRFRLASWMLRDAALHASGLLNPALGGPPVKPYQPAGIWEEMFMGRFTYEPSIGAAQYRRTLYAFWRRSIAPTMLFDNAGRQRCEVTPIRTNTPLQALTLLNDEGYREAALALGQAALRQHKDTKQQVQFMAKQVLSRTLITSELDPIVTLFKKFRLYYDSHKKDAEMLLTVGQRVPDPQLALDQQAAAMLVANLLLNTDEAITYE